MHQITIHLDEDWPLREQLPDYTCSMSSQSSRPTKIISLGRRWRVPPALTRNQEVRLISASRADLWPLMHPAGERNSFINRDQSCISISESLLMNHTQINKDHLSAKRREQGMLLLTLTEASLEHLRCVCACVCHMLCSYFRNHPRTLTCLSLPLTHQITLNKGCKWTKYTNCSQKSRHPTQLPNWNRSAESPNSAPHLWKQEKGLVTKQDEEGSESKLVIIMGQKQQR